MDFNKQLIIIVLASLSGLFIILASLLDWDFFFESKRAQFFVKKIGRSGARIMYSLLGFFLIYQAYKLVAIYLHS